MKSNRSQQTRPVKRNGKARLQRGSDERKVEWVPPYGRHDDQVDSISQFLNWIDQRKRNTLRQIPI